MLAGHICRVRASCDRSYSHTNEERTVTDVEHRLDASDTHLIGRLFPPIPASVQRSFIPCISFDRCRHSSEPALSPENNEILANLVSCHSLKVVQAPPKRPCVFHGLCISCESGEQSANRRQSSEQEYDCFHFCLLCGLSGCSDYRD